MGHHTRLAKPGRINLLISYTLPEKWRRDSSSSSLLLVLENTTGIEDDALPQFSDHPFSCVSSVEVHRIPTLNADPEKFNSNDPVWVFGSKCIFFRERCFVSGRFRLYSTTRQLATRLENPPAEGPKPRVFPSQKIRRE